LHAALSASTPELISIRVIFIPRRGFKIDPNL
jgi:hypothetical protein